MFLTRGLLCGIGLLWDLPWPTPAKMCLTLPWAHRLPSAAAPAAKGADRTVTNCLLWSLQQNVYLKLQACNAHKCRDGNSELERAWVRAVYSTTRRGSSVVPLWGGV